MHPQSNVLTPASTSRVLERYFEVALYLLLVAGFATLASTGKLDLPSVVLIGLVLMFRGYLVAQGRQVIISDRTASLLTLIYVLFYAADFFVLARSFVTATVHLVLFATVVKLFSVRRERDHLYLAVLSFLMVLAAAVLTVDSMFFAAFSAFLLVAVTTFILMEMRRSSAAAAVRARESADAARTLGWWLVAAGPAFLVLILLGGAAIFFCVPRVSTGYLGAYAPGGRLATGFSDSVRLGQIGEIQQSDSVVMHVQIEGDSTGVYDLKWRGVTLSLFDGRNWSNPLPEVVVARTREGQFSPHPLEEAPKHAPVLAHTIRYHVLMEPIGTNVFFVAGHPLSLSGPYRQIAQDAAGALYDVDRDRAITTYEVIADLARPSAALLRSASGSVPAAPIPRYLQLPPLDQRIPQLARQITASATTTYDKAAAIQQYLMTRYGYTLDLPRTLPRDPVANFLFVRKQGHCEYFASAMAIMLRTLGIPARIVNGFRGGEFNDLTGSYLVRARDAHSWVEAYIPGYGWTTFDPTPAGLGIPRGRWSRLQLYLDAASEFWREWVVNYDSIHQRTLEDSAGAHGRALWEGERAWLRTQYALLLARARRAQRSLLRAPSRWGFGFGVAVMILILLANAGRLRRGWRNRRTASWPAQAPQLAASIWYTRMTRATARRGWRKLPAQTPQEFVETIDEDSLRQCVDRFTRHYVRARFAQSTEDAERLPELYQEITSAHR
jgi:transglutaminase-like putative cysteine protease